MKKISFDKPLLFVGMVISAILGKIVRYTVMYKTLVLPGIGWHLLDSVNSNNLHFGFTMSGTEINETVSNATQNACFIFSKLNFLNIADSYYGYEILISIVFNVLVFFLFTNNKRKYYRMNDSLFIFASVAVLNIFDFCLAKEPIQMLYFLLMFFILISSLDNKKKTVLIFFAFILSAITYRNYYIIMALFFVYFYLCFIFLSRSGTIDFKDMILMLCFVLISHMLFMSIVKVLSFSNYNELIRVRFRGESGASTIYTLFHSTQPFLFSLDYLIVVLRMLIPIELLSMGPKYFIFALYQIMITYILIKQIKNYNKLSKIRKIAIIIYLAFLFGSALFEPDYGSWVRHEAVLFPIYLVMTGFFSNNKYCIEEGE